MASDSEEKKGVGLKEVAAGTAVGAGIGAAASTGLLYNQVKHLYSQFYKAENAELENFLKIKSTSDLVARHALEDQEPKLMEATKAAKNTLTREVESYGSSAFKQPVVAFMKASPLTKVGVGALIVTSALGTGWLVNKWRNSGKETHVERLERERSSTGPRQP